jgi:HEPN domain-containing protein
MAIARRLWRDAYRKLLSSEETLSSWQISEMLSWRLLSQQIRALLETISIDASKKKKISELLKRTNRLVKIRNEVAHFSWETGMEEGYLLEITPRGYRKKIRLDDILEITKQMIEVRQEVSQFIIDAENASFIKQKPAWD